MELELTREYTAQYTASTSHRNMDTRVHTAIYGSCKIQEDTLLEHVNEAQSDELS